MKQAMLAFAVTLAGVTACGQTQSATAGSTAGRQVPAKCTACHLAPKEHSLAAERWPAYLKAHERRLRLSDQEKTFLHDFLIARPSPSP